MQDTLCLLAPIPKMRPWGRPNETLGTPGTFLTYARLDTLFLTLPVSWKRVLTQYAGRLHRLYDSKKEVIIYDYLDVNIHVAARMYERRMGSYKAIGYEIDE